jgi:endonuclease/exonuclease/phosphatase (EEP) superfamily protein YafD
VFSGFLDEFRVRLDLTLKSIVAGAIVAFAGTAAFICGLVVLFLWVLQTYGLIYAWSSVAAAFGVIALFALIPLASASRRRRAIARAAEQRVAKAEAERIEKKNEAEWWKDPATLLTGIQIIRTLGLKRMLPVLAIGAIIAGFVMSRQSESASPDIQPAE